MAIVFIWNNNEVTTGHNYSGHASMCINDRFVKWADKNSAYVSWWGNGLSDENGYLPQKDRNFFDDVDGEKGYLPDHILVLDNVSGMKMQAKWNEIRNKPKAHYRGYYKNCSTIVARVLREGSSKGSAWSRHSHIWTPLKVKRLAKAMGGKSISWETFVRDYLRASGAVGASDIPNLMKLKKRTTGHGTSTNSARFSRGLDTGITSICLDGMQLGENREVEAFQPGARPAYRRT